MKLITPLLTLTFMLGNLAHAASDCKTTSATKKKDGHIVFDQTKLSKRGKKRLINHAIMVASAIASGVKMVRVKCIAPSYLLYNGANVVDGAANLANLIKHQKESRQILEAHVGEGSDIKSQIEVFDRAHEQQMKAYKSALRREDMLKAIDMARKIAVVAAGVELALSSLGVGAFTCSANPAEVKVAGENAVNNANDSLTVAQLKKIRINAEQTKAAELEKFDQGSAIQSGLGRNISGVVLDAVLVEFVKQGVGEGTPAQRLILYGAQEVLAMTIKMSGEVADCMKQRADEYKRMASSLRQRLGTTPGGGNSGTEGTSLSSVVQIADQDNFQAGDFAGCMIQSQGQVVNDPRCACAQTKSCYQIPSLARITGQRGATKSSLQFPSGLAKTIGKARNFLNGAYGGQFTKAGLAANQLNGQGAARLNRQINALKKQINARRKKAGKRPINFDARSKRLARGIQNSVGRALDKAGISSIGQFNRAVGDALLKNGDLKDLEDKSRRAAPIPVAGGGKGLNKGLRAAKRQNNFDFLDGLDSEKSDRDPAADIAQTDDEALYSAEGADIAKSQGNIFKIITLRYQQSGYPLLLESSKDQDSALR